MRIVDIAGVKLTVSEDNYNYYWRQRSVGENSDSFKTVSYTHLTLPTKLEV